MFLTIGIGALCVLGRDGGSGGGGDPSIVIEPYPTWADHRPAKNLSAMDNSPRPGVEAVRAWVIGRWGGKDAGIWANPANHGPSSDHWYGRAWDWSVPSYEAAQELLEALFATVGGEPHMLARRLGITNVIFDRVIYAGYPIPAQGFAGKYEARPYTGPDAHRTHVHISFSPRGAMGETSGYRGFLA